MSLNTRDAEQAIGARLRVLRGDQASGKRYETMPGAQPRLMHSWTRPGTNSSDVNPLAFGCNHCGWTLVEVENTPTDGVDACPGTKVGLPGYEPCSRCGLKSVANMGDLLPRCVSCGVVFNRAPRRTGYMTWDKYDIGRRLKEEVEAVEVKCCNGPPHAGLWHVSAPLAEMPQTAALDHDPSPLLRDYVAPCEASGFWTARGEHAAQVYNRAFGKLLEANRPIQRLDTPKDSEVGDGVALTSMAHPHPAGCDCDICIPF